MNWRFCPHCETQLDEATGICPACRWDPLEAPQAVEAVPEPSLMDRYRGTEYDTMLAMGASMTKRRRSGPTTKVRMLMLAGVLALFGLYGGLFAWTQMKDSFAPSSVPASVTTTR